MSCPQIELLRWSGRETGINAVGLNVATTSSWIPISGGKMLELGFTHVNTSGALVITATLQTRKLSQLVGGTLTGAQNELVRTIAGGVETLDVRSISRTVAGTENFSYATECEGLGDAFRLLSLTAGGAAATDLITMTARVLS